MTGTPQDQQFYLQASTPPPAYPTTQGSTLAGLTGLITKETRSPQIALACGISGYVITSVFGAVLAIIFGIKGRREARAGLTTHGAMATAGLWLGISNLVLSVLLLGAGY